MIEDYLVINKKVYNHSAEDYKNKRLDPRNISLTEKIVHPFIQYLNSQYPIRQKKILEIGPGAGISLSIFDREAFKLVAIDISDKMINASREICPKCDYREGNFLEYNFEDLHFDGIFANRVIHTFPRNDAVMFLKKAKNLLNDNGLIGITTNLTNEYYELFSVDEKNVDNPSYSSRFRRFWEEKDLLDVIRTAGLEGVYCEYYPYYVDKGNIKGINLGLRQENGK